MASFEDVFRGWVRQGPGTPRRLIYALPQGSVVEPVVAEVGGWLDLLELADEVGVHVAMGIWAVSHGPDWREDIHRPAVVIGTTEVLVSKALNRAFGVGPSVWPIDFALVTNGAHWVVHDGRRSAQAVAVLRQVEAATRQYGTAEPFELTVLVQPAEPLPTYPRLRGVERAQLQRLGAMEVDTSPDGSVSVLGVKELAGLFDTSHAGIDGDWGPESFGINGDDIGVAWATWTAGPDGAPDPEVRLPGWEFRCPVPLSEVPGLVRDRAVWRRGADGEWARVNLYASQVGPFDVLLVRAEDGGYDPVTGFDPSSRAVVPGCPELWTPAELAAQVPVTEAVPTRPWQSLNSHSEEVRDQAAALLSVLGPSVPGGAAASAILAGYLHDAGKAHGTWQDALCALAPAEDQEMVRAGRPWAKSGGGAHGRLEFAGGVSFLHELASLLLIDGPLRSLLDSAPDADLCRYLVLAHHGRLRTVVADPESGSPDVLYGLVQGKVSEVPPLKSVDSQITVLVLVDHVRNREGKRQAVHMGQRGRLQRPGAGKPGD